MLLNALGGELTDHARQTRLQLNMKSGCNTHKSFCKDKWSPAGNECKSVIWLSTTSNFPAKLSHLLSKAFSLIRR